MTEKQAERIRNKIKKIKQGLAADKRYWGGYYHDGGGLRYAPPRYYIQLGDFTGALRYFGWFDKNFDDDICYPEFLFEWTLVLHNRKRIPQAEKKALQLFCFNTYIIDHILGKPVVPIDKEESWELEQPSYIEDFNYSDTKDKYPEFTQWLDQFSQSERFVQASQQFIDIKKQLKTNESSKKRSQLLNQSYRLRDEF